MNRYGLIGFPLGHSFSQKYFNAKFEQERITNARYDLFPMEHSAGLINLLNECPNIKGLNVTIPHKISITEYLDDLSNLPEGITACNCIRISDGVTKAFNTDVIGFEKSLLSVIKLQHTKALILGNGGVADAVKFVLKKLSIPYSVVSRKNINDATFTYEMLTEHDIEMHSLIINCTPLGMYPETQSFPAIPMKALSKNHLVMDLIYNPEKTYLLQEAEKKGATLVNGMAMFKAQAEASWTIWNNQ